MSASLPLSGLLAVEMGGSVAAPYGAAILAELGATVIKVEAPGKGDDSRGWGPPFWHGTSVTFQSFNREKLSVTVDLKDAGQRARLRELIVRRADIVIQNLRAGLVRKFGLDYASLRADHPRLIYCNVRAYGVKGPLRDSPGYDPLMQAFGGLMSVTGEEGRAPVRINTSLIDMGSGMWGVLGILASLRQRDITGVGCEVDTSLFETALAWMTYPVAAYLASGELQKRIGSETSMLVPYNIYEATDGYIFVAGGNDNMFRRLCDVLGNPEWADDPRFLKNAVRVENRKALNALIGEVIEREPREHWINRLTQAGVPCAPLQSTDQVVAHEQTEAVGIIQQAPDGSLRLVGLPLSFDGERPPFRRLPPQVGQHNDIIDKLLAGEPIP